MDLPVKFPSETEVILEDAERFRALSARERMRALHGLPRLGQRLKRISPNAALTQPSTTQESLARHNIREFLNRHVP